MEQPSCSTCQEFYRKKQFLDHIKLHYCNLNKSSIELRQALSETYDVQVLLEAPSVEGTIACTSTATYLTTIFFRHVVLYYYDQGKTAVETSEFLNKIYGPEAPSLSTCSEWMEQYSCGDFDPTDKLQLEKHQRTTELQNTTEQDDRKKIQKKFKINELKELINTTPNISIDELTFILNVHPTTVYRHLAKLGMQRINGKWVQVIKASNN